MKMLSATYTFTDFGMMVWMRFDSAPDDVKLTVEMYQQHPQKEDSDPEVVGAGYIETVSNDADKPLPPLDVTVQCDNVWKVDDHTVCARVYLDDQLDPFDAETYEDLPITKINMSYNDGNTLISKPIQIDSNDDSELTRPEVDSQEKIWLIQSPRIPNYRKINENFNANEDYHAFLPGFHIAPFEKAVVYICEFLPSFPGYDITSVSNVTDDDMKKILKPDKDGNVGDDIEDGKIYIMCEKNSDGKLVTRQPRTLHIFRNNGCVHWFEDYELDKIINDESAMPVEVKWIGHRPTKLNATANYTTMVPTMLNMPDHSLDVTYTVSSNTVILDDTSNIIEEEYTHIIIPNEGAQRYDYPND